MVTKEKFVEIMAKHLPPSSSRLHLLDIGAVVGDMLIQHRPDIDIEIASLSTRHWHYDDSQFDAVVAFDIMLSADLLSNILAVMRQGGRFILINPYNVVAEKWVRMLEDQDFVRILVEPAYDDAGVLIRGEKVHSTDNTLERIQNVAEADANLLDFDTYRGRYIHLLIVQTPNKPVWKMSAEDKIEWCAITVEQETEGKLLAFSSLPKAVSFMQPAVLNGFVRDVNKVGKFSKATAQTWQHAILLNPVLSDVQDDVVKLLSIDSNTAEAPDE